MERTSKILLVITKAEIGGAQVSVFNLARELKRRGHDVQIMAGAGEYLAEAARRIGLPFIRLSCLSRGLNPLTNLKLIFAFRRRCNKEGFDVVHINSSNALFAAIGARWSRRPPRVVFTFRGLSVLDDGYRKAPIRYFFRLVFRFLLRYVDEAVFVSRANLETARRQGVVSEGSVVYNGLDPTELQFAGRKQARRILSQETGGAIDDQTFLVGSVGRLAYQKNYSFLVRQLAELSAEDSLLKAVIIGDGPEKEHLKRQIDEQGLSGTVFLLPERADAFSYLPAFDLFVLPSRYEGLSITLIEVLFAGVPALVSDVGGAREQFSRGLFQVYPSGEERVFRERFLRLRDNPAIRRELAEGNRRSSSDFNITRTADGYLALYFLSSSNKTPKEPQEPNTAN